MMSGGDVEADAPAVSEEADNLERRLRRERCAVITVAEGLPPVPPVTPASTDLQTAESVYEASLAPAFAQPEENSISTVNAWAREVLAPWARGATSALTELESAVGSLPAADREHGRLWLAHALAVFVERFHEAPIPTEVEADPELREMYTEAVVDRTSQLVERARRALGHVDRPYRAELGAWLDQEACAFR